MDELTKREEEKLFSNIQKGEKIEKELAFSWDGKNLIIRFPKDIADFFNVNEKNRFEKNIKFIVEDINGIIKKEFDIVERTKPKKKWKKKKN